MAASSSIAAPASTPHSSNNQWHEVFINHRGPDTKKTFARPLYVSLLSKGVTAFLDQEELQQGYNFPSQIKQAINTASVHVAILSRGYAESNWCLDELLQMLQTEAPIIPVFYGVSPAEVRWTRGKKGKYAQDIENLAKKKTSDPQTQAAKPRYDANVIENWRNALAQVADISGFELEEWNIGEEVEVELLDKVLQRLLEILKKQKPNLHVAKFPTGLDDKLKDFEDKVGLQQQKSARPQMLGIWGLGGIGKSTLAKEFYNRRKSDYHRSCFLHDIKDSAAKGTLNLMQRDLFKSLTLKDETVNSTRRRHWHQHRSDHDDDDGSDEEKRNKTRNKGREYTGGSLNGGRVQDEENSDVDRANGNRRDDYSRKKFSDYEADRGGKDRSSDGRKRRSKEESDRGRERHLDYDRKRHSQDELDRGRGRYEDGAEKYEEKRRRYDDDRRYRDSAEHKVNQSSGKYEDNYKRSRSSLSHKDSDASVDRHNREQRRDADTSKNGTVGVREGNITVELPKPKAPVVSTGKEGVVNTEKALGRSGGVYVPPFKLAQMMKDLQDKSSLEYQRMSWDALRKSINGLVNKVNASNIKNIIPELFAENLIRGRGLFCRSCMKSQMASPGFTDVFAALVAVVNTKFPEVGNLLLRRIILQLKRAFKRNDKPLLLAATKFIAHLANQQVAHEIIALELLTVLLENPTDDSVEVAVGFVKECGSMLQDLSPQGLYGIFERFRGILHEGEIDKRVQFSIEGLFAIRKANFQGYPAIRPELDLVEQEDQFTHEFSLEDELDQEVGLDIFKPDPDFLEHEKAYENLKKDILGEESSDEVEGENDSGQESDEDEDEEEEQEEQLRIQDETETNLVNLRRTIYLTIMSSVDFEEAGHKLLKIKLEPGQEMELCIMLLECCSQERTYLRYYGLLGQRFCMINKIYQEFFDKCFVQQYSMIHRLETNKLRNVAKFFAHLLGTDALPWHCLAYIRLTEEDTTSSSRIFIKILFQELAEQLGIRLLNERLNDPTMQDSFESIFPKDNPKNSRFAINFFTSIGLGGITESLREYLKNMPRLIMQQQKPISESDASSSDDDSSSSTGSSDSDSSESESESESQNERKRKRKNTRVSSASESESESESQDERRRRKKTRKSSHSESQSESDSDRKKVKRKRR